MKPPPSGRRFFYALVKGLGEKGLEKKGARHRFNAW
jgi:hypothetical protein